MFRHKHPTETSKEPTFHEVTGETPEWQDEWTRTLQDGRRVKFTNQELLDEVAFITAQIEGNKVVYSIILAKAQDPLSRVEVEKNFEAELSKKSPRDRP